MPKGQCLSRVVVGLTSISFLRASFALSENLSKVIAVVVDHVDIGKVVVEHATPDFYSY